MAISLIRPRLRRPALPPVHWMRLDRQLYRIVELGVFLILAQSLGPADCGGFIAAAAGVLIVEGALHDVAFQSVSRIDGAGPGRFATAFAATVAMGAAVSITLYTAAGFAAAMFDDAATAGMFQSLSLLPLLAALGVLPETVLRDEGRRRVIAAGRTAGGVLGGVATLCLVWADAGPWALVGQVLVQRFSTIATLWMAAGGRVEIGFRRDRFAAFVRTIESAAGLPAMAQYGPLLAIVVVLGPVAAGLYWFAGLVADALDNRGSAAPSDLPPAGRRAGATRIAECRCIAAFPAILAGAVLAPVIVPTLTDPRWWGAIVPMQWLLLAALATPLCRLSAEFAGTGGSGQRGWRALALASAVIAAVPAGLTAIAMVEFAGAAAAGLLDLRALPRALGPGWRPIAHALSPLTAAAAAAGGAALAAPIVIALPPIAAVCLIVAFAMTLFLTLRRAATAALRVRPHSPSAAGGRIVPV